MTQKTVTFTVELTDELAQALSQLVKRVGFSDVRQNAVDDREAYTMMDALYELRKSLQEAGYDPR